MAQFEPQKSWRAVERLLLRSRKDQQLYLINAVTLHQSTLDPRKILWDTATLQGPMDEDLTRVLGLSLEDIGRHWNAVFATLKDPLKAELIFVGFDPVLILTSEAI